MLEKIRFASIPKCASRTLKKLGLLGELEGRCHSKITEYPNWKSYNWMAVQRPATDWYRSWWEGCRESRNLLAHVWGMKFESMEEDLALLSKPELLPYVPRRPKLNEWVPENFIQDYSKYLANGLGLMEFCRDTIIDGAPCELINLSDLDPWLMKQGIKPIHRNRSEAMHAAI